MNDSDARAQLVRALNRLAELPADAGMPVAESTREELSRACYQFTTGAFEWVFPVGADAEVLPRADIAPLPGSQASLAGLCQLQGQLICVYQLHSLLNQPPPARTDTLILGRGEHRVGLLIDGLPQRRDINQPLESVPDEAEELAIIAPLLEGIYATKEGPLLALAVEKLGQALQAMSGQTPLTGEASGPATVSETPL